MSRQLITVVVLITGGILVSIAGCSEDCPTCPGETPTKPYKGFLYYVEYNVPSFYDLYVIDMETDSIVDSIDVPGFATGGMDVSADGRYLAVLAEEDPGFEGDPLIVKLHTYLYDAQTREFIREFPEAFVPYFDVKHNRMIGMGRYLSGSYFWTYSYPGLAMISVDTVEWVAGQQFDPINNLVYAIGLTETPYRFRFFTYDLTNHQLNIVPIIQASGDSVQVFRFCLSNDAKHLYFKGLSNSQGAFVAEYNLAKKELLWQFSTMSQYGNVALSLDESEIWATDPGELGYANNPGTVFILDASSGAYLHGISLWGFHPNVLVALAADRVLFSPAGRKAYIATGTFATRSPGSVLIVDSESREITKVLSPDFKRVIVNMRIGPKLE